MIKITNSMVIGTTSNIAVKIASEISGVANSKAKNTYMASKEL